MTSAANCGEYLHHCTVVLTTTEWYKKVTTQITHCCLLYSHGRSCSPAVHPSPYSSSPHAGQKTRDVGYNVTIPFVIPAKQNDTAQPQAPKILHCCVHCLLLSGSALSRLPSIHSQPPHWPTLRSTAGCSIWLQMATGHLGPGDRLALRNFALFRWVRSVRTFRHEDWSVQKTLRT